MSEYVHQIDDDESARIAGFLRWLAVGTVLFVVLVIVLFWTANRWLLVISPESERRFIEPYIEWSRGTLLVESDPALQDYVESLASSIHSLLGPDVQPIRVQVIAGDTVNAFATLGGYVFVFEGLVEAVDSENGLAMVLAHEIAHVHHRDPLMSTGRGMLIELALSTLSGTGIDPSTVDAGTNLMLNQYSREQEVAADELALSLLHRKYRHVGGAKRLFEIIRDYDDAPETAEFLSTHPDIGARIDNIDRWTTDNRWSTGDAVPYPPEVLEVFGRAP